MRNFNLYGYTDNSFWKPRSHSKEIFLTSTKAAKMLGISITEFGQLWRKHDYEPCRTGKNKQGKVYYLWSEHKVRVLGRLLEN